MQPFYQGKIDNFCALYAVLNAVHVLFRISAAQARTIFNRTLMHWIGDPSAFEAILEHRTDYRKLVDDMLADIRRSDFPRLHVEIPFPDGAPKEKVWECLRIAACPPIPRISVFSFKRFYPPRETPVIEHWTTGYKMDSGGLHLLDCSLEVGGIYSLQYDKIAESGETKKRDYVIISPESVRILSLNSVIRYAVLP